MDRLREALGDEKLTYLGYSYGTTLGSTYAELFPENVRALVLDAAVDPDADPVADAEAQAAAFEAGFDAFASDCRQLIAGCPLGDDPRAFLEGLLQFSATDPIPTADEEDDREATPGVVMTAVAAALYDQGSWPQLSQALVAARQGDADGLFSLADSYSGRLADGTLLEPVRRQLRHQLRRHAHRGADPRRGDPRARRGVGRGVPASSAPAPRPRSTPARCGTPRAPRCPSATRRAARRSW